MPLTKHGTSQNFLDKDKMIDGLTCGECGEVFQKPILATVSAGDLYKTYYACPRCLTKVKEASFPKTEEEDEKVVVQSQDISKECEKAGGKCKHFFGFLKKRPKNMPIPDECLTCDKMIECLT